MTANKALQPTAPPSLRYGCASAEFGRERLLTRLTVGRSWPGAETQSWGVNLIYSSN